MARIAAVLTLLALAFALPTAAAEAAPKKCKQGYVLKKVKKNGKTVKKCVKKKAKAPDTITEPTQDEPVGGGGAIPQLDGGTSGGGSTSDYTAPTDPVAEFTRLMTGSKWYRVYANTTSTGSTQGNDTIHFCSDGQTSQRHEEYIGHVSSSVEDSSGTWKVDKAAFAKFTDPQSGQPYYRAEALVTYTSSKTDDPSGQGVVNILSASPDFTNATRVYSGETEYQRTAGAAGC